MQSELLAAACSPGGAAHLSFEKMLNLLEAGGRAGRVLFSVDVATKGEVRPLPEWMFRLSASELAAIAPQERPTAITAMAVEFYAAHADDPELRQAEFSVYFEAPD